jgi:hypothetical protein
MSYESVRKGPYRFGPNPDKMFVHPNYFQFLVYMGMDCDDLSVLGAEVEITLGNEMERHTFNKPTIIVVPNDVPQGHTTILKVEKPFVFAVIRPLSSAESQNRIYL